MRDRLVKVLITRGGQASKQRFMAGADPVNDLDTSALAIFLDEESIVGLPIRISVLFSFRCRAIFPSHRLHVSVNNDLGLCSLISQGS
jgi:hypothetical protein